MTDKAPSSLLIPPRDWQFDFFENQHGKKLRYGWNTIKSPKALIILIEGHTECIEEYFETIRDLNDQGYACAIMDWQGQGLSYRYNDDTSRHHLEGIEPELADFHKFIELINTRSDFVSLPKVILAHSMGGHFALRYMGDYASSLNGYKLKGAYLTAPLLGVLPRLVIRYFASGILAVTRTIKCMERHAFGQLPWSETIANIIKGRLSSDVVRRELQSYLFKNNPALQCGGVTFGWVESILDSLKILRNPTYCAGIQTPIFIAIAGNDCVVDNEGVYKTSPLLPECKIEIFKGSEHQIHRERDEIRNLFLKSFLGFCEKVIA